MQTLTARTFFYSFTFLLFIACTQGYHVGEGGADNTTTGNNGNDNGGTSSGQTTESSGGGSSNGGLTGDDVTGGGASSGGASSGGASSGGASSGGASSGGASSGGASSGGGTSSGGATGNSDTICPDLNLLTAAIGAAPASAAKAQIESPSTIPESINLVAPINIEPAGTHANNTFVGVTINVDAPIGSGSAETFTQNNDKSVTLLQRYVARSVDSSGNVQAALSTDSTSYWVGLEIDLRHEANAWAFTTVALRYAGILRNGTAKIFICKFGSDPNQCSPSSANFIFAMDFISGLVLPSSGTSFNAILRLELGGGKTVDMRAAGCESDVY